MSLPRNPEELRGLRAANWIRESTPGQFDRYGPETQRRLIAAAIARLGLVNTGIEFSVARSGSTCTCIGLCARRSRRLRREPTTS
jgi:hypothetical protein